MKGVRRAEIYGAWVAGAATIWFAAMLADTAIAGIANTKHNLSTSAGNPTGVRASAGTDEVCVFCHTPHAAAPNASAGAPLWNKNLPPASYTSYSSLNSSTIDAAFTTVGSISLACLSCHDGTQAMDNVINAPGPGGFSAAGAGPSGLGFTWSSGTIAGRVDAEGRMTNAPTTASMLGTDLSNDHPIGITYCGGGPNLSSPAAPCRDKDFVPPSRATINGNLVWWVDTAGGIANTREKSDMTLYSRDFNGTTAPSVECGSCHDPHAESGTGTPPAGATFLRITNSGSAVCLACHVK